MVRVRPPTAGCFRLERSIQFEKERLKPLRQFFGDKQIRKIRPDDIRAYQRVRLEAGLSSKTINMDVGVLRLLLKRAKTWTLVADDVRLFPKRPRIIPKVLTHGVDIDIFNQTIRVRWSKTEAGHQTIPLNRDATLSLAKLRERAEGFGSSAPEHCVFPACENKQLDPNTPQKSWRSAWRRFMKAAGFPDFRLHL